MTSRKNLHGSAPDDASIALLIVDVINDFDFPGGEALFRQASACLPRIAKLKAEFRRRHLPVIYVNDNFGKWRSDFRKTVAHCREQTREGRHAVELLGPADDDYFVLKPKSSGFFSTTLEILLRHLGVKTIVITGVTSNICILFTAQDAFLRDYRVAVPSDCIAAPTAREQTYALYHLSHVLKADVRKGAGLFRRAPFRTARGSGAPSNA